MGAPGSFEDILELATTEEGIHEECGKHSVASSSRSSGGSGDNHWVSSRNISCSYGNDTNNAGKPVWCSPSPVTAFSSIFLFLVGAGLCGHALPDLSGGPTAAASSSTFAKAPRRLTAPHSDPCAEFPSIKIEKMLVNNLGGYGPDKDKPPGMVFEVSMFNVGLPQTKAHLKVNTVDAYVPNWVPSNGLHGEWAAVNWKPATAVTLVANFWDPETKKNLTIPRGYMTFSDIDAGSHDEKEFVTVSNFFQNYYIGDQTMVHAEEHILTTSFWGTNPEPGYDNPEQNALLTAVQKKKSVTLQIGNKGLQAAIFKFGSLAGESAREIRFGFQPTMLCSKTHMPDGSVLHATETGRGNVFPRTNGKEAATDFKSLGICVGKECDSSVEG
jgi:hypothetical protein